MIAPDHQTTLASWEADDVTVAQVEAALSDLRRHEQRAAVRTSVLNLVVVVDDRAAADAALGVVRDLGGRHPSRTLVLVVGDDDRRRGGGPAPALSSSASSLDAAVCVHMVEVAGRPVCFEDVVLEVRGRVRHHLDSLVEPFTLPDLPVVVWLPSRLPSPGNPLLATADRIVVDSRAAAEGGQLLPSIAALARRPVTDLSWMRLTTWRSLLAGLFEGPVHRPFLDGVKRVEVAGNFGPRYLLGGWLLRRLRLRRDRVEVIPAPHVSIRVTAVHEGRTGRFSVERPGRELEIHSQVDIEQGPCVRQTLQMRERWPALALADALTRLSFDDAYGEALSGALELSR